MRVVPLLLTCALALGCSAGEQSGNRPRNLLLISIDTLRADHVGAYGYPLPTTPNIDALAKDGLRFSSCVAHAPTTLTSHASLLTSLLPRHHGASVTRASRLASHVTTLAEVLANHGYRTASFNGGIQLDAAYGLDRGFEVYSSAKSHEARPETLAGVEDRLAHGVDRTIAWLDEHAPPFFVFLHSYEIHHPYTPDPEDLARFDKTYAGSLPDHISVDLLERINASEEPLAREDLEHIVHAYDAELRSADAAVGRLVANLRERELYEDTLIVLTSDHGEEFGDHGTVGWHAHTLYDELLLVPLVLKLPGSRLAGRVDTSQARGIDVAPTALAVLGIGAPTGFAGRDLLAEPPSGEPLQHPALSMHDHTGAPLWSIRTGRWKLKQVGGVSLYDLTADPSEQTNLAAQRPKQVRVLQQLGRSLLRKRERPDPEPAELTPEIQEQLRDLGYVE